MRLGQLARKLSLRPAEIVEFLSLQGIQIPGNSNSRMEDPHVTLVVGKFAPERLSEIINEEDEPEVKEVIEEVEKEQRPEPVDEIQEQAEDSTPVSEPSDAPNADTEVIRVQKIELSGLKVLGKIELPVPKKKEVETTQELTTTSAEKLVKQKGKEKKTHPPTSKRNRERLQSGEWVNPLEMQRQREAKEAEDRRRLELEREKEKRKKHYQKKVKQVAPVKRSKPAKEEETEPVVMKKKPTTWLGRFLQWWIRG
jgi:hypothetical protein